MTRIPKLLLKKVTSAMTDEVEGYRMFYGDALYAVPDTILASLVLL